MCDKILNKPIRFPSKFKISAEAQDLLSGFMERNPDCRLGSDANGGFRSIKDHVFFAELDWEVRLVWMWVCFYCAQCSLVVVLVNAHRHYSRARSRLPLSRRNRGPQKTCATSRASSSAWQ